MRRFIAYVFIFIAIVVGTSLKGDVVVATPENSWLDEPIIKVYEGLDDRFIGQSQSCGGEDGAILLRGEGTPKNACIFGTTSAMRMARYKGDDGVFAYAVAFPDEPYFTRVAGLCEGLAYCVYGQLGDTLLLQIEIDAPYFTFAIIKDFSRSISFQRFETAVYQFHKPHNATHIKAGNTSLKTGAAAVSTDGRWILVELVEYGLMRIDTTTGESRRVVAGASALGGEPMSLDISDDGRWVVKVGDYNGVYLYKIDETCGDTLTGISMTIFLPGTQYCKVLFLRDTTWFSVSGEVLFAPRFSANGQRLTLYRRSGVPVKTILAPESANNETPQYIAFGDSFTSGEGELKDSYYLPETNTLQNHCHVSTRSYPYLLQIPWAVVAKNLACSGSRMEGVRQASRTYGTSGATEAPTLVSLSVGGNDADFMGKLKNCIGLGTCEWAQEKYRKPVAGEIRNLFPHLVDLMSGLKREYAPASIFVVGYPDIVNAQQGASCSLLVGTLLDAQERKFMGESIRYLNKVLKAAAYSAKVKYADVEAAYGDERLCDPKGTAMNGLRYGDDIAPIPFLGKWKFIGAESFHPTPRGHQLVALAMVNGLGSIVESECTECIFNESDLEAPAYWREGDTGVESPVRLLAKQFLDKEVYTDISDATYHFAKDTFMPDTSVTFELHSEETKLAETVVGDDGSLEGSLELPLEDEGYHTVHANGTGRSGDVVDIYQTVYIGEIPQADTHSSAGTAIQFEYTPEKSVPLDEGGTVENEAPITLEKSQEESEVMGVQAAAQNAADHTSMKTLGWWGGVVAILGCVAFILWILLRKRKPRQQTKR